MSARSASEHTPPAHRTRGNLVVEHHYAPDRKRAGKGVLNLLRYGARGRDEAQSARALLGVTSSDDRAGIAEDEQAADSSAAGSDRPTHR
jgi:hypothetical protein